MTEDGWAHGHYRGKEFLKGRWTGAPWAARLTGEVSVQKRYSAEQKAAFESGWLAATPARRPLGTVIIKGGLGNPGGGVWFEEFGCEQRSHVTLAEVGFLHRRQDGEWDGRIRLKAYVHTYMMRQGSGSIV